MANDDREKDRKWLILIGLLGLASLLVAIWIFPWKALVKPSQQQRPITFAQKPASSLQAPLIDERPDLLPGGVIQLAGPDTQKEEDLNYDDIMGALGASATDQFGAAILADEGLRRVIQMEMGKGAHASAGALAAALNNDGRFRDLLKKFKPVKGLGAQDDPSSQLMALAAKWDKSGKMKRFQGAAGDEGPEMHAGDQGDPRYRRDRKTFRSKDAKSGLAAHEVAQSLNRSQWQARLAGSGINESAAYDFGFSLDAWAALQKDNREVLKAIETEGHDQPGPPAPAVATCSGAWCRLVSCGKNCVRCEPKYPFGNNGPGGGCGGPTWDYNQDQGNVREVCKYFGFEGDCKQACIDHPPCDLWAFTERQPPAGTTTPGGPATIGSDMTGAVQADGGGGATTGACVPCESENVDLPDGCSHECDTQ